MLHQHALRVVCIVVFFLFGEHKVVVLEVIDTLVAFDGEHPTFSIEGALFLALYSCRFVLYPADGLLRPSAANAILIVIDLFVGAVVNSLEMPVLVVCHHASLTIGVDIGIQVLVNLFPSGEQGFIHHLLRLTGCRGLLSWLDNPDVAAIGHGLTHPQRFLLRRMELTAIAVHLSNADTWHRHLEPAVTLLCSSIDDA